MNTSDTEPLRLAQLDSCAVSDAMDKLGLSGTVIGIQRLTTTRRISGRVHTVRMDKDDGSPSTRHLGTSAIAASQPGEVIVMNWIEQHLAKIERRIVAKPRVCTNKVLSSFTNPVTTFV